MIHFSEGSRKVESIDVPSFPLKYDLIKPETSISEKEAHDFWDEMFSEPTEAHQIIEADIQRDVYGRSEEDVPPSLFCIKLESCTFSKCSSLIW